MIVASEHQAKLRQKKYRKSTRRHLKEHEEARRTVTSLRHTQRAGNALEACEGQTGCCRYRSLLIFAEHIDPTCGAVVCDQQFLANQMGVSTRTIRRWSSKDYSAFVARH